jgi:hypothetical protein
MDGFDNSDLPGLSDRWVANPLSEVAYAINAAVEQAARAPIGGLATNEAELPVHEFLGRRESHCAGEPGLPRDPDSLLLDILPVSTTPINDAGRLQIEPDAASLRAWDPAERESAEQLVSWLNACGTAREAIANAIAGGSHRWDEEAIRYEDVLREAGYGRSNPLVQEYDRELRDLHGAIRHARGVLGDVP